MLPQQTTELLHQLKLTAMAVTEHSKAATGEHFKTGQSRQWGAKYDSSGGGSQLAAGGDFDGASQKSAAQNRSGPVIVDGKGTAVPLSGSSIIVVLLSILSVPLSAPAAEPIACPACGLFPRVRASDPGWQPLPVRR
jgi:hypothetical protein